MNKSKVSAKHSSEMLNDDSNLSHWSNKSKKRGSGESKESEEGHSESHSRDRSKYESKKSFFECLFWNVTNIIKLFFKIIFWN